MVDQLIGKVMRVPVLLHVPKLDEVFARGDKFVAEEGDELGPAEVELEALAGEGPANGAGLVATAEAGLFGVHEADGGDDEGADVPGGGPGLLVEVGEAGADGRVDLEAAGGRVEVELGRAEGIVLVQLQ